MMQEEKIYENVEEQIEIRGYLLGFLDDTQIRKIEEKLLLDDLFDEKLLIAEEKLIEDYLENNLDKTQREAFDYFFLSTPHKRQQFRLTKNLFRYANEAKDKQSVRRPVRKSSISLYSSPIFIAAGVTSVILIFFFSWTTFFTYSETDQVTASLNRAYKYERPFKSRLADLNYAPIGNTRGNGESKIDTRELEKAESISLEFVSKQETSESLRNEGRIFLVKKDFNKAQVTLEKAMVLAPQNARIANDLGAAQLELAETSTDNTDGKSLELKAKALGNFEKAIELDQHLIAAYFNRAHCLQAMSMFDQAREAWEDYLKRDSTSLWAEEARKNLEAIQSTIPRSTTAEDVFQDFMAIYRQKDREGAYQIVSHNREMITGKLIAQRLAFLFLTQEGSEKQEYLSALDYVGQLEKEISKDPFFSEIAKFYSQASRKELKILRNAHNLLREGYELCLSGKNKDAFETFSRSRKLFEQAGSYGEVSLTDYWIAYCENSLDRIKESSDRLSKLSHLCLKKDYKWLSAQVFYWLAVNEQSTKETSKSWNYSRLSLEFSEKTFDLYNTQKTHSFLAESLISVKRYSEALGYMARVMPALTLPEYSERQKWRDMDRVARLFYGMKLYAAAAAFEAEALNLNRDRIKDVAFERISQINLSKIYTAQQKFEIAISFAENSRETTEKLPDLQSRQKGFGLALLQTAELELKKGDFLRAANTYEKAIELYSSMNYKPYLYEAKKGRLLCYLAAKNDEAVQKAIPEVLALFEDNRDKIREEQSRNTFFNDEHNIYDLAIDYEHDQGNNEQAFNYAESSRSRSLLDWQKNSGKVVLENGLPKIIFDGERVSRPLPLVDIRAGLPEEVQLVYYALLPDKVLIWLISKEKFETFSHSVSAGQLTDDVIALITAIKYRNSENQIALSRRLFHVLFSQVESHLDPKKPIFLIPDKILCSLPFVALISSKTENYLVVDYQFSFSPSANTFLMSTENAGKRKLIDPRKEQLLSIGNPSFDRQEFPDMQPLPEAETEAANIANLYPEHTLLLTNEATKSKIKESIKKADVVQFAGHYVTNEGFSLLSSFAVSGIKEESRWANYEIFGEPLARPRLIVLSACETGVEKYYSGEGMIGASRTFLALGVPVMVASQWKVESMATAELMKHFHEFRKKQGFSTTSALQHAQLEMLKNSYSTYQQPFYWAGFIALGGYAQF